MDCVPEFMAPILTTHERIIPIMMGSANAEKQGDLVSGWSISRQNNSKLIQLTQFNYGHIWFHETRDWKAKPGSTEGHCRRDVLNEWLCMETIPWRRTACKPSRSTQRASKCSFFYWEWLWGKLLKPENSKNRFNTFASASIDVLLLIIASAAKRVGRKY